MDRKIVLSIRKRGFEALDTHSDYGIMNIGISEGREAMGALGVGSFWICYLSRSV